MTQVVKLEHGETSRAKAGQPDSGAEVRVPQRMAGGASRYQTVVAAFDIGLHVLPHDGHDRPEV